MALRGIKVIEFAGLAPAPFCGMILRDHGASVTRIDRPNAADVDTLGRGKRSLVLDMKKKAASSIVSKLCSNADVLIDPFRPGVMEKFNLGPNELMKVNPRLVYARMTGFGQNGPFSKMAGHDINYIAISGVLSMLGGIDKPHQPVNLLGDFAGGGLICALGVCLALLERHQSGKGQVIDANMVEGSAYISTWLWTTHADKFPIPFWNATRGKNLLDGGSHFYQTYQTKDGKFMAVGALESQFYRALCKGLELDLDDYPQMMDWEEAKAKLAEIFRTKTQAEWCQIFDSTDACVTPIIQLNEAHNFKHNVSNKSFVETSEGTVPIPAPRLSRTPGLLPEKSPVIGGNSREILIESGFGDGEINVLVKEGVVHESEMKSSL